MARRAFAALFLSLCKLSPFPVRRRLTTSSALYSAPTATDELPIAGGGSGHPETADFIARTGARPTVKILLMIISST